MADQNNAPERIWVRVTDKTVMYAKPSDADEFDVEYIRADRAAPEGQVQCCMCGRKDLSTVEGDGGEECQLWDGRWTCSRGCYDKACMIHEAALTPPSAAPTDNTALVEAAYHAGIDAAANRYRVCASPDVWDYFYTAYNAMLDLKTFPMPAALASREAPPAGQEPVAWRYRDPEDDKWRLSDDGKWMAYRQSKVDCEVQPLYTAPPPACQQEAVTVAEAGMAALKELANTQMNISLTDWQRISSTIDAALRALKGEQ